MKWIFHTIPQPGELGNETWGNESWKVAGGANVWSNMSADPELGYVYLPVGSPVTDYYGGHRPGDNLFANSLVCLDADTGERVWHFQFVHHTVWDYDLPAAPNLIDITVDGRQIKAVAQITKQGFTFVFDRATGEPVWPIEERPVPQSTVPGERTSPTQPFPTRPPVYLTNGSLEAGSDRFHRRAESGSAGDLWPAHRRPALHATGARRQHRTSRVERRRQLVGCRLRPPNRAALRPELGALLVRRDGAGRPRPLRPHDSPAGEQPAGAPGAPAVQAALLAAGRPST